jgi:hypothetical protein
VSHSPRGPPVAKALYAGKRVSFSGPRFAETDFFATLSWVCESNARRARFLSQIGFSAGGDGPGGLRTPPVAKALYAGKRVSFSGPRFAETDFFATETHPPAHPSDYGSATLSWVCESNARRARFLSQIGFSAGGDGDTGSSFLPKLSSWIPRRCM